MCSKYDDHRSMFHGKRQFLYIYLGGGVVYDNLMKVADFSLIMEKIFI